MIYRYKCWIEKEVKCMMKLKYFNVLQYFGLDFERLIFVIEFLWKEVRFSDGEIECVYNVWQLFDVLEDDLLWIY